MKTHGERGGRHTKRTKEYTAWVHMVQRCTNKNHPSFKDYGGRGIKVCNRWLKYKNFLEDMGRAASPELSLDRFPNNNGQYKPGNCRWATPVQQSANRRVNRFITINGQTKTVTEWGNLSVVSVHTFKSRIKNGWDYKKALSTPPQHSNYSLT